MVAWQRCMGHSLRAEYDLVGLLPLSSDTPSRRNLILCGGCWCCCWEVKEEGRKEGRGGLPYVPREGGRAV